MRANAIIILIRNPQMGLVKTRLAATIGDRAALKVYEALLEYTRLIVSEINVIRLLFYSDFIDINDEWDNKLFIKFLQEGNNLGERMRNAFKVALKNHDRVIIIGSDCEELTPKIIREGFNMLSYNDVVLGPAEDGGYYLMGLKIIYPELFLNKEWSSSNVFEETLNDIKDLNLKLYLLPVLSDIDDFDDFKNSNLYKRIKLT